MSDISLITFIFTHILHDCFIFIIIFLPRISYQNIYHKLKVCIKPLVDRHLFNKDNEKNSQSDLLYILSYFDNLKKRICTYNYIISLCF